MDCTAWHPLTPFKMPSNALHSRLTAVAMLLDDIQRSHAPTSANIRHFTCNTRGKHMSADIHLLQP